MMKIRVFGLTLTAAVTALTMTHSQGQQASDYRYPPLSGQRYQYYQQHPDEFQNLLKKFPALPQVEAPGARLPPDANLRQVPGELPPAGGTWSSLTNSAGVALMNPVLLNDGRVLLHTSCNTLWYILTPSPSGLYAGGTWTQAANTTSLGYGPRFFGSGVLPDGRVVAEGGEYNGTGSGCGSRTTLGAIYNPTTNTWASISPPSGWGTISDAAGIVLPNGTYMQTSCCDNPAHSALLNPSTLTWTATGTGKFDPFDEEAMALLPTDKVLTVDAYTQTGTCGKNTEIYTPSSGAWASAGNVSNQQADCNSNFPSYEVGPLVMRPNGTAVSFSGLTTGVAGTSIYNVAGASWSAGPNIPSVSSVQYTLADAPGAVLPNGNVLFAASPGNWTSSEQFPSGILWFEMSISDNSIAQVASKSDSSSGFGAWEENLLLLPNGQVLATTIDGTTIQLYTPGTGQNYAYAPTPTTYPSCVNPGGTYTVTGTQLNGMSEGAYYGDDVQGSTNFPIVVIYNNNSGNWWFAKTFNPSNRSIATGNVSSASFTVPAGTETTGTSGFYVIANGIASTGVSITVQTATCPTGGGSVVHDFNGDGKSDILWRANTGDLAMWLMNGATVSSAASLGNVGTVWSIVGVRDFNGDGKADILWRDTAGDTAMWLMNGATVTSSSSLGNVSTAWSIVGTGDYNGDGKGDILWRDTSGDVAMWLMNGSTVTSSVIVGNVSTLWSIVGSTGKGILWRDTAGDVVLWIMNGGTVSAGYSLGNVATSWSIVGAGDFNGDGNTDILWRDTSGNTAIWFLNNAGTVTSAASLGNISTAWSVVQVGDFNGDGKSDILWRATTGDNVMWLMNGSTVTSSVLLGNVSTAWSIQAGHGD